MWFCLRGAAFGGGAWLHTSGVSYPVRGRCAPAYHALSSPRCARADRRPSKSTACRFAHTEQAMLPSCIRVTQRESASPCGGGAFRWSSRIQALVSRPAPSASQSSVQSHVGLACGRLTCHGFVLLKLKANDYARVCVCLFQ